MNAPRKNDVLTSLRTGKTLGVVTRKEGDICHYKNGDKEDLFIWRFKDGFNKYVTWPNKEDAEVAQ